MKNFFLLLFCSIFYLPATPATAQQQIPAGQPLEKIETAVIRFQKSAPRINESLETMKEAKASYIQELTAAPGNVHQYRSKKSRRQMVGVYGFDLSYATVFDRKKQAKADVAAIQQLLKALGFNDRKVSQQHQQLMKDYGTATLKTLIANYEKVLNESFRDIATTDEGGGLIAEAAYGWLIEGLYVTAEIVAQQNYSPLMLYRINEHAECIKPVVELLETVKSNPKLSQAVASSEQQAVLTSIATTLKSVERISKKEIDAVRAIISKARAGIVN